MEDLQFNPGDIRHAYTDAVPLLVSIFSDAIFAIKIVFRTMSSLLCVVCKSTFIRSTLRYEIYHLKMSIYALHSLLTMSFEPQATQFIARDFVLQFSRFEHSFFQNSAPRSFVTHWPHVVHIISVFV